MSPDKAGRLQGSPQEWMETRYPGAWMDISAADVDAALRTAEYTVSWAWQYFSQNQQAE